MAVDERVGTRTAELQAERERLVARGIATAPIFVERAHGARLTDVEGREYIDFVGGIGVLNGGHTPERVVAAIQEQAAKYLHQCYSIAQYEPFLEVCRRHRVPPGRRARQGAAGQHRRRGDRERRQDRPLPHGPPGHRVLRERLPRPHADGHEPDLEGDAVQEGLRPVRARGLPRAGAVPVPRHRHRRGAGVGRAAVQEPGRPLRRGRA